MTPSFSRWGAWLPRLACAFTLAALGTQAQANTYAYGGDSLIPIPTPTVPVAASLTWSTYALGAFELLNAQGTYTGRPGVYQPYPAFLPDGPQPTRVLTPSPATSTLPLATSGSFSDTLTWDAPNQGSTLGTGGTFSIANITWQIDSSGQGLIYGQVSGKSTKGDISGTLPNILLWTVASSAVHVQSTQIAFDQLSGTTQLLDLMGKSLGLGSSSLGYAALMGIAPNMGSLTIQAVPEPATWAQLSLGLGGMAALGAVRRSRRERNAGR